MKAVRCLLIGIVLCCAPVARAADHQESKAAAAVPVRGGSGYVLKMRNLTRQEQALRVAVERELNSPANWPFVPVARAYRVLVDEHKKQKFDEATIISFRQAIEAVALEMVNVFRPAKRLRSHSMDGRSAVRFITYYLGSADDTAGFTNYIGAAYELPLKGKDITDIVTALADPKKREAKLELLHGYYLYYQIKI